MTETGFIEYAAYEARGVKLTAALAERDRFLERLTALSTAMRKIKTCDFVPAVDAVKGSPDEKLVRDVCSVYAKEIRLSARLQELLDHFLAEAGVDPESFDPWDDHGV